MNIYRSFEQWKNGGFLEHGAPRTEEYTAEELHLVEMGWNYGYDAGRAVEQALDKKADNARELGLSYDDAVKGGVGIMLGGKRIDPASIYAEPKIGCVNHDCAQCRAVQEPVAWLHPENATCVTTDPTAYARGVPLYTAPQPVPVKTYHDGKPWPVAPKPWVGLTDEELKDLMAIYSGVVLYRAIEAKLKEKNT
jgi:hypothetical protein